MSNSAFVFVRIWTPAPWPLFYAERCGLDANDTWQFNSTPPLCFYMADAPEARRICEALNGKFNHASEKFPIEIRPPHSVTSFGVARCAIFKPKVQSAIQRHVVRLHSHSYRGQGDMTGQFMGARVAQSLHWKAASLHKQTAELDRHAKLVIKQTDGGTQCGDAEPTLEVPGDGPAKIALAPQAIKTVTSRTASSAPKLVRLKKSEIRSALTLEDDRAWASWRDTFSDALRPSGRAKDVVNAKSLEIDLARLEEMDAAILTIVVQKRITKMT